MYGYNIPNNVVRQAVDYRSAGVGGALTPVFGRSVFGATEPGALDKLKEFMDKETMGVKNKYLLAGAAALGVGYYGYTKGWF